MLGGAQLDAALSSILASLGSARSSYSWHSARIALAVACSMLEAGATSAQIQALCRWQTEDSLRVYARLNGELVAARHKVELILREVSERSAAAPAIAPSGRADERSGPPIRCLANE